MRPNPHYLVYFPFFFLLLGERSENSPPLFDANEMSDFLCPPSWSLFLMPPMLRDDVDLSGGDMAPQRGTFFLSRRDRPFPWYFHQRGEDEVSGIAIAAWATSNRQRRRPRPA